MIVGVGVDTVPVERIKRLVEKYRERFVNRIFTQAEIEYAFRSKRRMAERLAGRFAVKEAVMKVLGTGKSQGILWKDVETLRGSRGRPEVVLRGAAKKAAEDMGIARIHVSITHDGGMAIAFVIAEDNEEV